jgi:hypothetical protein
MDIEIYCEECEVLIRFSSAQIYIDRGIDRTADIHSQRPIVRFTMKCDDCMDEFGI